MRRAFLALLLLGLALVGRAKPGEFVPSTAPVRAAIERTITGQLAAFRRDDYPAARELAAAPLREKFPLAEFETMVRRGYPRIAGNHGGRLADLLDDGDRAIGRVAILDADGGEMMFRYILLREGEVWRIAGLTESVEPKNDT